MMKMMKHFLPIVVAGLFMMSCGGGVSGDDVGPGDDPGKDPVPAFKEEPDDPAADPKGLWDYSRIASHAHPRLLMDSTEFAAIQEAAKTNDVVKRFNDMIIADATPIADVKPAPMKYQIVDDYLIYVSWEAVHRILFCAYSYRATGEKKFLDVVERELQAISLFPDWYPSHYLGTAELALAAAIGYDWCYKDLSLNTRKMVRRALNLFAFETAEGAGVYKKTNNWNQVCLGGLTMAAIATYEKNKAASAKILDAAVPSNTTSLQLSYSPDGNYAEGYNYWGYATIFQSVMLTVFEDFFGHDNGLSKVPGWKDTADYLLFMVGTTGLSFNYSDCAEVCSPKAPMWYFAWKQKRPELITLEKRHLDSGAYIACSEWRFLPMAMKWIAGVDISGLKYPEEHLWTGRGEAPIAMVHTDWTWSGTDKYLGVKAGQANAHHGHMDSGSFVYDAFGQRWANDIGPEEYAPLEALFATMGQKFFFYEKNALRWTCFRLNDKSHNTLTINGALHDPNGPATITSLKDTAPYGIGLDMTRTFADQAKAVSRSFTLDGDVLTIADAVQSKASPSTTTVSWHMATRAVPTIETDRIKLELGGKTIYLSVSAPGVTPVYKAYEAKGDKDYDTPNPGFMMVGWEAQIPANTTVTFNTTLKP